MESRWVATRGRWSGDCTKPGPVSEQEKRRIDAVMLVDAGVSQAEVARQYRVSREAVRKWVNAYRRGGREALVHRPSPGQRVGLPARLRDELERGGPVETQCLRRRHTLLHAGIVAARSHTPLVGRHIGPHLSGGRGQEGRGIG